MFIWTLPEMAGGRGGGSKRLPGWLGAPSILGLGRAKKSPRVPACVRGGCVCVCVQSLFGQCPNRHRVKLFGASLKKTQNFWVKKIGPIAYSTMRGGGGGGGREIKWFWSKFCNTLILPILPLQKFVWSASDIEIVDLVRMQTKLLK